MTTSAEYEMTEECPACGDVLKEEYQQGNGPNQVLKLWVCNTCQDLIYEEVLETRPYEIKGWIA
jgi:hypothetical protein